MTLLRKYNLDLLVSVSFVAWCSLLFVIPAVLTAQEPEGEGDKLPELGLYLKDDKGGTVNLRVVENQFRVYFLDRNENVVSPAFKRARIDVEWFRNKDHEYSLL